MSSAFSSPKPRTVPNDPRASALLRMQLIAMGLLLAALAGLALAAAFGGQGAWGWVKAFCEAAAVGALADWFAVVALFRHPLGLPIHHTAIIPQPSDSTTRNWLWKPLAAAFTLSRACCKAVNTRGTCSTNSFPARVSRVLRVVRTKSCAPRSSSNSLIAAYSVDRGHRFWRSWAPLEREHFGRCDFKHGWSRWVNFGCDVRLPETT